jgi:hypothetical protein
MISHSNICHCQDCSMGLRRENLVVSIGGDLLSPYPLSTLDKGRGMVEPWRFHQIFCVKKKVWSRWIEK